MATAGQRLLNASGQRILTSDGKQRNSDGTDECASLCCYDPGGPTTATITFSGCSRCWDCDPFSGQATLTGNLSGTFTLSNGGSGCTYTYDAPYTATQLTLDDFSCSNPLCSTTRIQITLAISTVFNTARVQVTIYNTVPTACGHCGDNALISAELYDSGDVAFDPCGDTVEAPNDLPCDVGNEAFCNYIADSGRTMLSGCSAVITL